MQDRGVKLWGWLAIAGHLEVSENTAVAHSRISEDPLPVRVCRGGAVYAWSRHLDEWQARRSGGVLPDGTALERYEGRTAMCKALGGCDTETLRAWAQLEDDRLPVMGLGTRRQWIYASALRDWVLRRDMPVQTWNRIHALAIAAGAAAGGRRSSAVLQASRTGEPAKLLRTVRVTEVD